MNKSWENTVVTKIALAIYVAPESGRIVHTDRPYHGLVLNDEKSAKDYIFSDGTIMRTEENDLFYLPKYSTYRVVSVRQGGCYAINFDAEIDDKPFIVNLRNNENVLKSFRNAEKAWRQQTDYCSIVCMRSVYDIIAQMVEEMRRKYMPSEYERILEPAMTEIHSSFTKNGLSIEHLAEICEISEAYFRRIFINKLGITPKEYIINMRINYAKQLLESKQFSVSEIALMCGYSEQCHFSREFSKRTGMSPMEYKKQNCVDLNKHI